MRRCAVDVSEGMSIASSSLAESGRDLAEFGRVSMLSEYG
jgi:hypothetical protein